jgi:hypothetical protein
MLSFVANCSVQQNLRSTVFKVKNCSVSAEAGSRCDTAQLGLNDLETWKCYELESYEGIKYFRGCVQFSLISRPGKGGELGARN